MKTQNIQENDIRPDHLMDGQSVAFLNDIARLNTRREEFVHVPCPACGKTVYRPRWRKYGLNYVECETCATVYVNPRPTPVILEWYYGNSENYRYFAEKIFPASEANRRERIFRPRVERIAEMCERHGIARNLLLEIGPGFGTFCQEVMEQGLFAKVMAVEPTPELAESCRRRGVEVIGKPVEQVDLGQSCADVVASFEVIEHLFEPAEFVAACSRALRPGGLLVLTCPNLRGFEIGVLGPASDSVDVEHLNYFHPASLSALVRGAGLEVLEVTTPGLLDVELVRKKVLAGEFAVADNDFIRQVLIENWENAGAALQQFLMEQALSSHMWLVARKPIG